MYCGYEDKMTLKSVHEYFPKFAELMSMKQLKNEWSQIRLQWVLSYQVFESSFCLSMFIYHNLSEKNSSSFTMNPKVKQALLSLLRFVDPYFALESYSTNTNLTCTVFSLEIIEFKFLMQVGFMIPQSIPLFSSAMKLWKKTKPTWPLLRISSLYISPSYVCD